jgi:opine dehydrogenase
MTASCSLTRILLMMSMGGWWSNQSLAWVMVPRSSLSPPPSTLQRLRSPGFQKHEIRRRQQTCIFAVAAATSSNIATTTASTEKNVPSPNQEIAEPGSSKATSTTSGPRRYRVGIIGAGAVAFGTAAVLDSAQQDVMLWSPSGKGTQELLVNHDHHQHHHSSPGENDKFDTFLLSTGALESSFSPRVASSCRELVDNNDVLVLAVPANGHKHLFEQVAKFIRSDQTIIISSHASFGALYLSQLLQRERPDLQSLPMIIAWGTTVCTARKQAASNAVRLNTVRTSVDMCVLPASSTDQGLELCQQLFSSSGNDDTKNKKKIQFQPRDGLLAIALSNVNPQNHLGIALGNISRMENKEEWFQMLNITPTIGRLLEALDQERLQIANMLNVQVKILFEHFSLSFHVPISDSISDMGTAIYKSGNDVHGPSTADSRYVTEDVPFGLVPTIVLGKLVGRPTPLHESGVQIMSAMYGRDFFQENDLLQALRLEQYTLEELMEASQTGTLPSKTS